METLLRRLPFGWLHSTPPIDCMQLCLDTSCERIAYRITGYYLWDWLQGGVFVRQN